MLQPDVPALRKSPSRFSSLLFSFFLSFDFVSFLSLLRRDYYGRDTTRFVRGATLEAAINGENIFSCAELEEEEKEEVITRQCFLAKDRNSFWGREYLGPDWPPDEWSFVPRATSHPASRILQSSLF